MREVFHGELEQLGNELAVLAGLTCVVMDQASGALLETDLTLAERAINTRVKITHRGERCEEHACTLLALQAPVARELRIVVAAIRTSEKLARMGDLACHIAELVRLRHPQPVLPEELTEQFSRMGELASRAGRHIEHTIAAPVEVGLPTLERIDDELDWLHRDVLDTVARTQPPYPVQVGVDVALLARYHERYGDQAVSVTRQLDYVITGDLVRATTNPAAHTSGDNNDL